MSNGMDGGECNLSRHTVNLNAADQIPDNIQGGGGVVDITADDA
jgi:hypothetical protein